jgi:hypothetical protein
MLSDDDVDFRWKVHQWISTYHVLLIWFSVLKLTLPVMVGILYRLSKFYATLPKFIQMSHQTSQSLKSIWFLRTNNRTKVHFHFITSGKNTKFRLMLSISLCFQMMMLISDEKYILYWSCIILFWHCIDTCYILLTLSNFLSRSKFRTNNRTKVHFHFITSFENKVLWKIKNSFCGTDLLFSDNQISYFVLV